MSASSHPSPGCRRCQPRRRCDLHRSSVDQRDLHHGPILTSDLVESVDAGGRAWLSVRLRGDLCADNEPRLRKTIEPLVDRTPGWVEFDLDALDLCTSDGVELWIDLARELDARGDGLALAGVHGLVGRVIAACGLPDLGPALRHGDERGRPLATR